MACMHSYMCNRPHSDESQCRSPAFDGFSCWGSPEIGLPFICNVGFLPRKVPSVPKIMMGTRFYSYYTCCDKDEPNGTVPVNECHTQPWPGACTSPVSSRFTTPLSPGQDRDCWAGAPGDTMTCSGTEGFNGARKTGASVTCGSTICSQYLCCMSSLGLGDDTTLHTCLVLICAVATMFWLFYGHY